jgi:hypothetical protein
MEMEGEELDEMMETLFMIFYVNDAYIASRDPIFLQRAIDGLVGAFERVGLKTNTKKTQAMTCTPGNIRLQLPTKSYLRMRTGRTSAAGWDARKVTCRECGKDMQVSSLGGHYADQHEIYQQQVVADELLDGREGVVYWSKCPVGLREAQMPIPLVQGGASKRVDDATAFSGPTSNRLCRGEEGGEVSAMPTLRHAGGSVISGAC